jgi:hypothetical protein
MKLQESFHCLLVYRAIKQLLSFSSGLPLPEAFHEASAISGMDSAQEKASPSSHQIWFEVG